MLNPTASIEGQPTEQPKVVVIQNTSNKPINANTVTIVQNPMLGNKENPQSDIPPQLLGIQTSDNTTQKKGFDKKESLEKLKELVKRAFGALDIIILISNTIIIIKSIILHFPLQFRIFFCQ